MGSNRVKSQIATSRQTDIEDELAEVYLARLVHGVYPNPRTIDLNLVGVHSGIRDENLCVLHHLRLPHPDLLVQYETNK